MGEVSSDAFDQEAFSASAAALVASHAMSDAVWKTYFPEIPDDKPELRTVLITLHRQALAGRPLLRNKAYSTIATMFSVDESTARTWINLLTKLGFLVKRQSETKESAYYIFPSTRAKTGLFHVGTEYLVCLRLVGLPLQDAIDRTHVDVNNLEWLEKIKELLALQAEDYKTFNPPTTFGVKEAPTSARKSGETYNPDEERD